MLAIRIDVFIGNLRIWIADIVPKIIGIMKPNKPNAVLFSIFFLKSLISISNPERNIIYNSPAVPESIILLSRASRFKPKGPMIIPAKIIPKSWGNLSLSDRIGVNRIMTRIIRNFSIGSEIGNSICKIPVFINKGLNTNIT